MGCCGSKDGAKAKKVSIDDIADQPEIEGITSVNDVCAALWGIKDKWEAIRKPLSEELLSVTLSHHSFISSQKNVQSSLNTRLLLMHLLMLLITTKMLYYQSKIFSQKLKNSQVKFLRHLQVQMKMFRL